MAENNLVEELVSSLIKDKTIKPSERNSVSDILSKAIQNVPNDQIQSFKKRIELLSESSNSLVFSNSGVNVVALQGVVNSIVESVSNTKITSENTTPTQPHQLEALIDAAFEEKQNSQENINEDYPIYLEGTPEYEKKFNEFDNDLKQNFPDSFFSFPVDEKNIDDDNELVFDDNFDKLDSTDPNEIPEFQTKNKIQLSSNERAELQKEIIPELIRISNAKNLYDMYINQGFSEEEAMEKTFSNPKCDITREDLEPGGALHEHLNVFISNDIEKTAKRDGITPQEVLERYPENNPSKNMFSFFLTSKEQQQCINQFNSFSKKAFTKISRIFYTKSRCETACLKDIKKHDDILKQIQALESTSSKNFKTEEYVELLKQQSLAENNMTASLRNLTLYENPNAPINDLINTAALKFLTSDKSVSDIYYEIKNTYPSETISFDDILNQVASISKNTLSTTALLDLKKNERDIHELSFSQKAYNLAFEKGILDSSKLSTKALDTQKNSLSQQSLAYKQIYCESFGLDIPNYQSLDISSSESKDSIIIKNLFNKVIQNQLTGLSEFDSIEKACHECGIQKSELQIGGQYHQSLSLFFLEKIQNMAQKNSSTPQSIITENALFHPKENPLLKAFLTEEEKFYFYKNSSINKNDILKKNLTALHNTKKTLEDSQYDLSIKKMQDSLDGTPDYYIKSLFNVATAEKNFSHLRSECYKLQDQQQPFSNLLKKSVEKYFSGNQSLVEIYNELKQNENCEIYFEDLAQEAKNMATKNGYPSIGKQIYTHEYTIYSNTLKIEGYNLAIQKSNLVMEDQNKISEYNNNISNINKINQKTMASLENSKNIIAQSLLKTTPSMTEPEMQNQVTEEHTDQEKPLLDPKKLIDTYHLDQDDSEKDLADIKALVEQDKNKVNVNQQHTTQNEKSKNEGTEK